MADIVITGPDGSTFTFPDGTSQSDINAAMIARYPPMQPGSGTAAIYRDTGESVTRGQEAALARTPGIIPEVLPKFQKVGEAPPDTGTYVDPMGDTYSHDVRPLSETYLAGAGRFGARTLGRPVLQAVNAADRIKALLSGQPAPEPYTPEGMFPSGANDAFESGLTSATMLGGKNEFGALQEGIDATNRGQPFASGFTPALQAADERDRVLRENHPASYYGGGILGTGATAALTPVIRGGSLATRVLGNAAIQGAQGAAGSWLSTDGTIEDRNRAAGVGGVLASILGAGGSYIEPKPLPVPEPPPSGGRLMYRGKPVQRPPVDLEGLKSDRSAAYKAVDASGEYVKPEDFGQMVDSVTEELRRARINARIHPDAAAMMDEIKAMRGQPMTMTELDQLRQAVSEDVAGSIKPRERYFGKKIIEGIDNLFDTTGTGPVIRRARDLNTRVRKIEAVQEAVEEAKLRAASTHSGGNVDNATRQNLRRVLKKTRNLTPDERKAMTKVVSGAPGQNALRLAGKLAPGGNGLALWANMGSAATLGPLGAVPAVVGTASKFAADRMTQQGVDELLSIIAAGGKKAAVPKRARPFQRGAQKAVSLVGTRLGGRLAGAEAGRN